MFPLLNIVPVVRPQERVVPVVRAVPAPADAAVGGQQRNRRKCSHCREEGHNINQCLTLNTYIEDLYNVALREVQHDVDNRRGGYYFENWVLNLSNRDTQYLVWKCQQPQHAQMAAEGRRTNILRRISDVESRTIVFDHFASLDLGYVTRPVRLGRHYNQAYRAVQSDVAHQANGTEFQNYLKNYITEWQQRDIYEKILETRRLRDSLLEEREFPILWAQWDRRPRSVLTNQEFIIHTHFSGIAELEYDFRVRNMTGYLDPNQVVQPQHRVVRVGQAVPRPAFRDSLHIRFQENQSVTLRFRKDGPYPVAYLKDYKIVKEDAPIIIVEEEDDCPICLETKTQANFLKMGCTHGFCNTCVGKIIATAVPKQREVHCPLCRDELREIHYSDFSKVKTMFKYGEQTNV